MLLKMDTFDVQGWDDFVPGKWQKEIEVRDFIQKNYTPYEGDDTFLAEPTQDTKDLWQMVLELSKKEREAGGVFPHHRAAEGGQKALHGGGRGTVHDARRPLPLLRRRGGAYRHGGPLQPGHIPMGSGGYRAYCIFPKAGRAA